MKKLFPTNIFKRKSLKKKSIIIFATCQGGIIYQLLLRSKELLNNYQLKYYLNFSRPGHISCYISKDELKNCDLFLYHPIQNKKFNFSTDQLLALLPRKSNAYTLPYITFGAYWPYFGRFPTNPLGVDKEFPYGRIPYRSELLDKLIIKEKNPDKIIKKFLNLDESSEIQRTNTALKSDFQYLERLDAQSGLLKIKEYVASNYKKRQLFYIFNHPKKEVYLYLVNQLLKKLGFALLSTEEVTDVPCHLEQNMPIHPITARLLQLEFTDSPDMSYNYLNENFTFEQFVKYYIDLFLK